MLVLDGTTVDGVPRILQDTNVHGAVGTDGLLNGADHSANTGYLCDLDLRCHGQGVRARPDTSTADLSHTHSSASRHSPRLPHLEAGRGLFAVSVRVLMWTNARASGNAGSSTSMSLRWWWDAPSDAPGMRE